MQGKEKESRCPGSLYFFSCKISFIDLIINIIFGEENPFASRKQESRTEKDATEDEFKDGPIPASNNTPNE